MVAGAVMILSLLVLVTLSEADLSDSALTWLVLGADIALMAVAGYYHWRTWRCPSCEAGLGRDWSPQYCQHCGTRLRP
jgi:hypothetical protein